MKNIAKKCLLGAGSLVAALLIAEGVLRVFVEQETRRLAVYDRVLGWRGRPGGEGVYVRRSDAIRVPYRYNQIGYRDDDIRPRKENAPRVVLLGDSFVESLEVDIDVTFHRQVEQQMRDAVHPDSEVMVLAAQGYSTAQQVLAFQKYEQAVDADVVLMVFYTGNDFEENLRPQFALLDDDKVVFPPNTDSWSHVQSQKFQRWLYESSHLVFLVKNAVESATSLRLADASKEQSSSDATQPHAITHALVRRAHREVRQRDRTFGMVVMPSRDELTDSDLAKVREITALCDEEGIPCLNLSSVLSTDHYFVHDVHLNTAAHQVVAEAIYEFLQTEDAFQGNRPEPTVIGGSL